MSDIELLGATYHDVPAVELPKPDNSMALFIESVDGNDMQYGSSSCIVGTATVGTGYAWTKATGDFMIVGKGVIDTNVVA